MEYFEDRDSALDPILVKNGNNFLYRDHKIKVAYRCLITMFIIIVSSGIIYSIVHFSTSSRSPKILSKTSDNILDKNSSYLKNFDNHTETNSISFVKLMNKANLTKITANQATFKDQDDGCICRGLGCGCCATLVVPEIHLNNTGCLNFALLPSELGISLILAIDRYAIINETVSPQDALCVEPPYLNKILHFCIYFYDLDVTSKNFRGCVQLRMKIFHLLRLKEWNLGCFNLALPSLTHEKLLKKMLEASATNKTESFTSMKPTKE